ncbi:MAG TPA: hypothetical protein VGH76_27410 [Actinomycetospora sp.]|uniref:hypothetical protein n=1 Tax=Actinomycetospora sp. TaxID=1872135 RepID=UPI002F42473B
MRRRLHQRYRLEVVATVIAAVLALVTLVWADWIELLTGLDPDGGNGELEWLLAAAFAVVAVVCGVLARRDHRRLAHGDS